MAHLVEFRLRSIEELLEEIDEHNAAVGKAVSYTVKDIKSRAPGWIADEAASKYNIKKSEITPKTKKSKKEKAVSISVSGETLESISIVYVGRRLTPIHFSMSPKSPKRKKKYSISYEVLKGSRQEAHGKRGYQTPFLAPVEKGSDKYIVFQRVGAARKKLYSVRTVSVPQTIENENVEANIKKRIMEAAEQRLQNHLKRFVFEK